MFLQFTETLNMRDFLKMMKFYALCSQLYVFVGNSKVQSRRILPIFVVMCTSAIRSARRNSPHGANQITIHSLLSFLT